MVTKIW